LARTELVNPDSIRAPVGELVTLVRQELEKRKLLR
jgi:hypothetical protein